MNPPPALVAAFAARIDRVLDRVATTDGAMVLVQPFDGARDHGSPWPADLPLPLTVADARAAVARDRDRIATEHAANMVRLVAALVPVELQAGALEDPAVTAAWPWYMGEMALHALTEIWAALTDQPGEAPPYTRWWPACAWARSRRSDIGGKEGFNVLASGTADGLRWHAAGLDALYRHLWARSPLFAAVEAGRLVRELTAPADPGPAYLTAIRDVLGMLAESDALALAALEVTPDARRRLPGYAVDLLDAARKVAALFAVDPGDDAAARETAETPHGPALRWDVDFAALLTAERADTVRENAAARWAAVYGPQRPLAGSLWKMWTDERWLRWLAAEQWAKVWRPARERERIRPAVTTRIGRGIVALHSPATLGRTTAEGVELVTAAGDLAGRIELDALARDLFARGGSVVPADAARRAATELVRARATTAAVFAFLHAIRTVTALARRGDGGMRETWESWNAWVDEVAACYDVKPTPDLRRLLCNVAWFGHAVQVPLFDGRTQRGLWTLNAPDPFKRGKPDPTIAREVAFSYAQIFDPKWAARENSRDRNRGVRLMSIPDRLPVGVPDPAIRGSLYLYTLAVLAEVTMADYPDLGVRLDRPDLARGVALADGNAERQLRAMLNDTPTQGPLLELVSGDRYRLAGEDARTLSAPRFVRGSR